MLNQEKVKEFGNTINHDQAIKILYRCAKFTTKYIVANDKNDDFSAEYIEACRIKMKNIYPFLKKKTWQHVFSCYIELEIEIINNSNKEKKHG